MESFLYREKERESNFGTLLFESGLLSSWNLSLFLTKHFFFFFCNDVSYNGHSYNISVLNQKNLNRISNSCYLKCN